MKALIISRPDEGVPRAQIYPFHLYRQELVDHFGFIFEEIRPTSLEEIDIDLINREYDVLFFQWKVAQVMIPHVVEIFLKITIKKVCLDSEDSTGLIRFELFPNVDLYVKKQGLLDHSMYEKKYYEGRFHADQIRECMSPSLAEKKQIILPQDFENKFFVGWNVGTAERLIYLMERQKGLDVCGLTKTIDVACRIQVDRPTKAEFNWYINHRALTLESIARLSDTYRVIASDQRMTRNLYEKELLDSKICVSPWGYGEVCYRDFEAVLAGALLVKPPMEHVETEPFSYRDRETYVRVAVDFHDLKEVCDYYLSHEEERLAITRRALAEYRAYFEKERFLERFAALLKKIE